MIDLPQLSDNASIYTVINSVIVLIIAVLTIRNGRNTKKIRNQVENNHFDENGKPINMREESDERHSQNTQKLDDLVKVVDTLSERFNRMVNAIERLIKQSDKHDDQIHDLEMTQPRPPVRNNNRRRNTK